ncbi:MAG: UDP-N-acetylmuramate dehydrogenase, partial [Gammaproteobacteria bacterium]
MPAHLPIQHDFNLQRFNTFGIAARARAYLEIDSVDQFRAVLADPGLASQPRLLLGGGSNILLTGDVDALVLRMALRGRAIVGDTGTHTLVQASAGENWHAFVQYTLAQGLGGLENMSLIPGTVGAAPIQNIGAYGAEIKDSFHSLTALDMASGQVRTMTAAECRFAYRDSVFKHADGRDLALIDVTFALPKAWTPNLRYTELAQAVEQAGLAEPTARQISDLVVAIRRRKLPDPAEIGNAGSFFKNPVVARAHCE